MTRDEFMAYARNKIDEGLKIKTNRLMNLVEQAWAEGKRNAEVDTAVQVIKEAFAKTGKMNQSDLDIKCPYVHIHTISRDYYGKCTCEYRCAAQPEYPTCYLYGDMSECPIYKEGEAECD